MSEDKIHHSRRVYYNGDYVDNFVYAKHLEDHINYNKTYRPGCGLIIDGEFVNDGYLDPARKLNALLVLNNNPVKIQQPKPPYQ